MFLSRFQKSSPTPLQFPAIEDVSAAGAFRSRLRRGRVRSLLTGMSVLGISTLVLAPAPGFAATATTTFSVTATVVATCTVSALTLPFGNYTGVVDQVTSTVTVQCTNTTPYTVGLSAGSASGATETTRKMVNGAVLLPYGLYTDAGRTVNWGNIGGTWVSGTGNGALQPLTVYGQIAAGNYVTPGSYLDTITATVTY